MVRVEFPVYLRPSSDLNRVTGIKRDVLVVTIYHKFIFPKDSISRMLTYLESTLRINLDHWNQFKDSMSMFDGVKEIDIVTL